MRQKLFYHVYENNIFLKRAVQTVMAALSANLAIKQHQKAQCGM